VRFLLAGLGILRAQSKRLNGLLLQQKQFSRGNNKFQLTSGESIPALGLGSSAIGLGTWKSAPGEVGEAILQALQLGYRHFPAKGP
jgi:hypothetical protein